MAKTIGYVVGAVLAIAGIWALAVPPALGMFEANNLLAGWWLVSGLVLLGVAWWADEHLPLILMATGALYAILAALGFVLPGAVLGALTNTTADNWLHAVLAVVLLVCGFIGRESEPAAAGALPSSEGA